MQFEPLTVNLGKFSQFHVWCLMYAKRVSGILPRTAKRAIFRLLDCIVFLVSAYISLGLRFEFDFDFFYHLELYGSFILVGIIVKVAIFHWIGLYRPVLRFAGLEFLYTALKAVIGSGLLTVSIASLLRFQIPPRSFWFTDALTTFLLLIGVRLFVRWLLYDSFLGLQLSVRSTESGISAFQAPNRVIIYGAGTSGFQLVQALARDKSYRVMAFVDDNAQLHHQFVHGVQVYPSVDLSKLISRFHVDLVLLAMPSAPISRRREIVQRLRDLSVEIKVVPTIDDILSGKVSVEHFRKVDIVDLLGRDEVLPNPELLRHNIKDKVVLITGAGGSIGSEMCRQIAQQGPRHLVLFELNEFALYNIDLEMGNRYPSVSRSACLGSVTDFDRLKEVMLQYQVETVYHAAAYKHVPLVEMNPAQGVVNNVWGTLLTAWAARESRVEMFVLISTDKAVRPTNVMGATKRVAELVLQALAAESNGSTRFVMVRFGNVLDSNGSVVPLFRKQIAEGKSLTVTHPDITRYFMSIPEAARLVIQAGALGKGGEVFLLDMGEPVKIYDLAVQMIELSGLIPGKDVDIEFVGLRPGEKLYEELLIDQGNALQTQHPKIYSSMEKMLPWEILEPQIDQLLIAARRDDAKMIATILKRIVPEYAPEKRHPRSSTVPTG